MSANIEQIKAMLERAGKTNLLQKQTIDLDKERLQLEATVNKEKIDNNLEEAAVEYSKKVSDGHNYRDLTCGFIAGAEWYKEQFEKNRLFHCDALSKEDCDRETDFAMEIIEKEHRHPTFLDAINYGMRLQKEQMLKDAVEGKVYFQLGGIKRVKSDDFENPDIHFGDKVKLIIVKEDEE